MRVTTCKVLKTFYTLLYIGPFKVTRLEYIRDGQIRKWDGLETIVNWKNDGGIKTAKRITTY